MLITSSILHPRYAIYVSGYSERSSHLGGWGAVVVNQQNPKDVHPLRNIDVLRGVTQDGMTLLAIARALKVAYGKVGPLKAELVVYTRNRNVINWIQGGKLCQAHTQQMAEIREVMGKHAIKFEWVASSEPNQHLPHAENLARQLLR